MKIVYSIITHLQSGYYDDIELFLERPEQYRMDHM